MEQTKFFQFTKKEFEMIKDALSWHISEAETYNRPMTEEKALLRQLVDLGSWEKKYKPKEI